MESIYYVICWACHRKCRHCYDERFRPYVRGELDHVVEQAKSCSPKIVDNLPERMTYLDLSDPLPRGGYREKTGRIILSGGEVLVEPVREMVLYPLLERLSEKYRRVGGIRLVIQTTGDLLTERIIDQLLARDVWMISVAGMDDFHVGMEGDKRVPLQERLVSWFEAAGMAPSGLRINPRAWTDEDGPVYSFFGATPDAWIGKIWPRGRAWRNDLSTGGIADNFCNAWSGGLGFLNHRYSGSEVSIEPSGDVYPCCMKTKLPIGNLTEEPLIDILDSLIGEPVYEALSMGHPERMGIGHGWEVERFLAACETHTAGGRTYRNMCIGCDRFHEAVLGPVIAGIRDRRRLQRRVPAE